MKPSPLLGLSSSKPYAVLVHSLSISSLLRLFSGTRKWEVMESIGTTSFTSVQLQRRPPTMSYAPRLSLCVKNLGRVDLSHGWRNLRLVSSYPFAKSSRSLFKRVQASGSGLETSIADATDSSIKLKKAKISVESQTENQIELRVDVIGEETDRVFGQVLTNLARTAPPIPGFRRQKGAYLISLSKPDPVKFCMFAGARAGKTTKVPRDFLLRVLGEERVTKFVIQEIVTSTVANYVKTENLIVKDNRVSTSQSTENLESSFNPGNDFGFNAVMELQSVEAQEQAEATSS